MMRRAARTDSFNTPAGDGIRSGKIKQRHTEGRTKTPGAVYCSPSISRTLFAVAFNTLILYYIGLIPNANIINARSMPEEVANMGIRWHWLHPHWRFEFSFVTRE